MEGRGLYRGLLIVGVLAILGLTIVFATEKKDSAPITAWETYRPESGDYSVSYPKGWKIQERDSHGVSKSVQFTPGGDIYLKVQTSDSASVMMDIMKTIHTPEKALKSFHEELVKSFMEDIDPGATPKTTQMKVGGSDAFGSTLKLHSWNGLMGRSMEAMLVSTMNGNDYVALMYICPTAEREKVFSAFGTFMGSFKPI